MSESTSRQSDNSWRYPGSPRSQVYAGTSLDSQVKLIMQQQVSLPETCGKGTMGQINIALLKFFTVLKGIKKYAETYVLGTINKIQDITNLISQTAEIIGSILKILIQRLRNYLMELIRGAIEDVIEYILPTIAKVFKDILIDKVVEQIICVFDKIIDGLVDFVVDFLFAFVQEAINPAFCAVEGFTNAMINNLAAVIDKEIQPILDQINDVLGGVVKVVGDVFTAIDYILGFESFLCQPANCPEINSFRQGPWGGPSKTESDNYSKFLEVPSASSITSSVDQALGNFFGDSSDTYAGPLNCNTNPYACGLPQVEFFGGGGAGAAGLAIVNTIGEVVGVDLIYPGTNYKSAPFVTFSDSCGDGNYASGHAVINDKGEVTAVIIDNPGGDYNNGPSGKDEFGNPTLPTPPTSPETPTPPPPPPPPGTPPSPPAPPPAPPPTPEVQVREYVGCLTEMKVLSTGIGYTVNDEVVVFPEIPNLEAVVKLTEQGQVISIELSNIPCDITEVPKIIINSNTGSGASIKPIVKYTRISKLNSSTTTIEDIESQTPRNFDFNPKKVIRVIDCVSR
jgi:hypothetical protein